MHNKWLTCSIINVKTTSTKRTWANIQHDGIGTLCSLGFKRGEIDGRVQLEAATLIHKLSTHPLSLTANAGVRVGDKVDATTVGGDQEPP